MRVTPQNKYPLWETATRANAQAMYDQMRQHDPVYCAEGVYGEPVWIVTRYDDALTVLRDPRFIKDARKNPQISERYGMSDNSDDDMFAAVNRHMLNQDPPDHTRLRALVHKAFTPRRVQDLQPRIQQIIDDLLDDMTTKDSGDLIEDFAYPLPITVIAEMLGIPADDHAKFREWTEVLLFNTDFSQSQLKVMEFVQYVNERIDERRGNDTGDILSALVNVSDEGDTLNHMELLSMIFLLLVAGHETTVNLIANGTLALLRHPDQMQLLRDDPSLIGTAIEEMLRWNGPIERPTPRWTSEDIVLSGVTIPQYDLVFPALLAANRDPAVFENPNTFDITRDPNKHIAFGHGIHYCIGAPLARMEGALAINRLLARLPDLQLAVEPDALRWKPSTLIHGMEALPVRYRR